MVIKHFYENIPGWFDFQDIYLEAINRSSHTSHFVEVGCYHGRSAAFMCVEIFNSNKKIIFDCIDIFKPMDSLIPAEDIPTINQTYENLSPVNEVVNYKLVEGLSDKSASLYRDGSLDFVFIDADHSYESVYRDIVAWKPKVKIGGLLAGHDFSEYHPGVVKAVVELLPGYQTNGNGNSWKKYV